MSGWSSSASVAPPRAIGAVEPGSNAAASRVWSGNAIRRDGRRTAPAPCRCRRPCPGARRPLSSRPPRVACVGPGRSAGTDSERDRERESVVCSGDRATAAHESSQQYSPSAAAARRTSASREYPGGTDQTMTTCHVDDRRVKIIAFCEVGVLNTNYRMHFDFGRSSSLSP